MTGAPAPGPVGPPVPRRVSRFPGWWPLMVQIALVAGAAVAYFGVRGLTQGAFAAASGNARTLIDLERLLHVDWEAPAQAAALSHEALVNLANWVYIFGHWPVVAGTLVLLFVRLPDRYYLLRNAMFISGAIGLVIFALVPLAPPRLGMLDLVDTVTQRSDAYRTLQPPSLTNPYAAMPSLHFGWNLLVGVVIWRSTRRRTARALALIMVTAMALAVVATANHYVLDVVAGGAVAMIGLALARALPRVVPTPAWARTPDVPAGVP